GGGEDVQRVEALQALEPEWQNILNVDDRCGPEEDLERHADQLRRVAHEHVEQRGEYAQAEAEGELQCDEGEPEEERRMERMPRQGEREQEHAERERQVDGAAERHEAVEDRLGEGDLADQVGIVREERGAAEHNLLEPYPGE